jgi:prephenate dehydrogenase
LATLTIVGSGLIGGSIALATRRNLPDTRIVVVDRDPAVVDTALRTNLADDGGDDLARASGSDLVVLAAPVRQNIELLKAIPDRIAGEVLVTDVGSTKLAISDAARTLPPRVRFLGGHPIAGAASGGIESVRRDLFQGRPWVLTPLPDGDPRPTRAEDLNRIEGFVRSLGGVPYRLSPVEHDRLMTYVSHLPQLTVSALMQVVGDHVLHEGLLFAGNGLRDSTRLASSPPGTWRDIASTNAPTLKVALDDLIAALERLRDDLEKGEELDRVFEAAGRWKGFLG